MRGGGERKAARAGIEGIRPDPPPVRVPRTHVSGRAGVGWLELRAAADSLSPSRFHVAAKADRESLCPSKYRARSAGPSSKPRKTLPGGRSSARSATLS